MKKKLLSVLLIAASFTGIAQVGIGTTTPQASAALDIESTVRGFLPPRMTDLQMNAITTPVEGIMVYCTDCIPKGIYVYDGQNFNANQGGVRLAQLRSTVSQAVSGTVHQVVEFDEVFLGSLTGSTNIIDNKLIALRDATIRMSGTFISGDIDEFWSYYEVVSSVNGVIQTSYKGAFPESPFPSYNPFLGAFPQTIAFDFYYKAVKNEEFQLKTFQFSAGDETNITPNATFGYEEKWQTN
jgi:hypothetical protein